MGHSGHSNHHHDHPPVNDKAVRAMVILTLCLFFGMTVIGHFVFVAGGHQTEAASSHGETEPGAEAAPHESH